MVENQTESQGQGAGWKAGQPSGVQVDVQEALDTDLDAYLDRELFIQPDSKAKPTPAAEKPAERLHSVLAMAAEEEQWLRTRPVAEQPVEISQELEGGECPIPEHLKEKPAPVVEPVEPPRAEVPWTPPPAPLPGLAAAPHLEQPGWDLPAAPAPVAQSRTPWIITGALVGVSAASVLLAGMLWVTRDSLPSKAQAVAAYVPTGTVTAVVPPPATSLPEPVLSVKNSPLPRQPEQHLVDWSAAASGAKEVVPGPVVPGRMAARQEPPPAVPAPNPQPQAEPAPGAIAQAEAKVEPKATPEPVAIAHAAPEPARAATPMGDKPPAPIKNSEPVLASVKAEALQPREKVQARKASAVAEQPVRREVEDPLLAEEEEEEETPFMQTPVAAPAPAPVAKAEPQAAPKPKEKETDFDEEFHRQLGFSKDSVRQVPESKGVKSVWIPPDPRDGLPETLTPADIQQVVVANQPAIVSCIRRHKDAIPGLSGGKFVLRWFVLPDGSTVRVLMETQALRGTALATCLEELARDWKFPKHRTQMAEPVRFPFTF